MISHQEVVESLVGSLAQACGIIAYEDFEIACASLSLLVVIAKDIDLQTLELLGALTHDAQHTKVSGLVGGRRFMVGIFYDAVDERRASDLLPVSAC